ncbi:MAG: hypothetical protein ABFD16_26320, partial [Thermoguttaceae bacterium]
MAARRGVELYAVSKAERANDEGMPEVHPAEASLPARFLRMNQEEDSRQDAKTPREERGVVA